MQSIQAGGVTVDGHDVGDLIAQNANEAGIAIQARLDPQFLGEAVLYKPRDGPLAYVADTASTILPGQDEPTTSLSRPRAFEHGMLFRSRSSTFQHWLYRWSLESGVTVVVDDSTPTPDAGPLSGVGEFAVLRRGIAFASADSGGAGIFLVNRQGGVERLVTPGQRTTTGETIVAAWAPSGRDELLAFRGRVAEIELWESVFVRTPEGVIYRLVGGGDFIDGRRVFLATATADEDDVALRVDVVDPSIGVRGFVYRVRFGAAAAIPTVSSVGLVALAALLVVSVLWQLARRNAPGR